MKRILVATDFSARSDRAIRRATLLAKQFGAALSLIHVVDDDRPRRIVEAERKEASLLLGDQARSLREVDGVDCIAGVVLGIPCEEIVKAAEASMADVLVIGPHRHQGLTDVFVGTTAERAIRTSRRPVLMASGVPAAFYRHVLVAVDLSDCSGEAVRAVTALGLDKPAAVSFVHVFDAPAKGHMTLGAASDDEISDYLAREEGRAAGELAVFLRGLEIPWGRQLVKLNEGSVANAICAAARDVSADLIIVCTHGRTGITKLLLGSVAEDVLHVADQDVLAVPPRLGN